MTLVSVEECELDPCSVFNSKSKQLLMTQYYLQLLVYMERTFICMFYQCYTRTVFWIGQIKQFEFYSPEFIRT